MAASCFLVSVRASVQPDTNSNCSGQEACVYLVVWRRGEGEAAGAGYIGYVREFPFVFP